MNFYPTNSPIPERLQTDNFVLVPLTPDHVYLDYAALMSSKEMLRVWSGSPWPSDDFTLAQNLEDLEWHWAEHKERIAFTFTVLNPTENSCLGCVYIKSMAEVWANNEKWEMGINPVETPSLTNTATASDYNALVRFWATQPTLAQELDKTLLQTLRHWFASDWAFTDIYWHTPVTNQQQITLFQTNGLQNLGEIHLRDRGGQCRRRVDY